MKPLLAAGALLLLTGCAWVIPVPHIVFTAPQVSGVIAARDSDSRLEGARIFFVGRENADAISGADGAFVLDRQIDVPLVAIGGEDNVYHFPTPRKMPAAIRVVKSGYADRVIQLRPYYLEREKAWQAAKWPREPKDKITLDLGTITLEPLASPAPTGVDGPAP
jgi:hypothetical protein